jgi:predicted enzyme involved in methoxymalonyl-ACP biosynthesis
LGQYIPTSKNALVAGLYSELGFEPFESSSLGSWWRLDLKRHVLADIPLRVNANL